MNDDGNLSFQMDTLTHKPVDHAASPENFAALIGRDGKVKQGNEDVVRDVQQKIHRDDPKWRDVKENIDWRVFCF